MTKRKKTVIVIISIILVLLIGTGAALYFLLPEEALPGKKKKKKKIVVVKPAQSAADNLSSDDSFYDDDYSDGDFDTDEEERVKRELYQKTQNNTVAYVPEYTVKQEKWNGPKGYVIVIPNGDAHCKKVAESLKSYFKKAAGVELEIVTDKAKERKKEILIGNTDRYKSSLKENEYAVKLKDSKLIFESGHFAMLEKAVDWFTAQSYKSGTANTLTGKTKDFAASKSGGYKYVWGDEFAGNTLDKTNWGLVNKMGGTALLTCLGDENVLNVNQDNLRLTAIRYFNKNNPVAQYATNTSVCSMNTMSFKYGYLEMSARVPFRSGAWPSFWANSSGALNNNKTNSYTVEVDFFEVFSSVDTLIPNIHKWRGSGKHSQYNSDNKVDGVKTPATPYTFENTDNLTNEYHIYGFKWTPKEMKMYVDGTDYMTFDLTKDYDGIDGMEGYNVPLYLIINNYMFAPDVGLLENASVVNNLDLPFEYDIDWIRLYQIPGQGELNLAD